MLIDCITRVAGDAGYHLTTDRNTLNDLFNRACKEIYDKLECNRIYRELTLAVPRNKIVSVPSYVGVLRGMRPSTVDVPAEIHAMMSPRYVNSNWIHKWNNWRDLGESPVHTLPAAAGQLTIEAPVIEGATILIAGNTGDAARIEEQVGIAYSPVETVTVFGLDIQQIACMTVRTCDIVVKDVNGNAIATLYNTDNRTKYKLFDVAELFYGADTSSDETLVDILFKLPLKVMHKDTDSFPGGDDYDNAIYFMMMYLHYKPMTDRKVDAADHRAEAFAALTSIKSGTEESDLKKISFGRNKYYGLTKSYYDYATGTWYC